MVEIGNLGRVKFTPHEILTRDHNWNERIKGGRERKERKRGGIEREKGIQREKGYRERGRRGDRYIEIERERERERGVKRKRVR